MIGDCPEKFSLSSAGKGCKSDLVAKALELGEVAALETFGVVAFEVVSAEFAVGSLLVAAANF
jgi:hypothetical protein